MANKLEAKKIKQKAKLQAKQDAKEEKMEERNWNKMVAKWSAIVAWVDV